MREEEAVVGGGGGGCCGCCCCCCCWLGREEEDWASFMSMSMNMATSRSTGSAGGVWVGGVAAGGAGAGAVEAGGGARPSLEPSGLGDGEEDDQNQVMVRAGFEVG